MSSYALTAVNGVLGLVVNTGLSGGILTARYYGETVATTAGFLGIYNGSTSASVSPSATPEKLNSRQPAKGNSYGDLTHAMSISGAILVQGGLSQCSHSSWISQPRYFSNMIEGLGVALVDSGGTTPTATTSMTAFEDTPMFPVKRTRRTTRPGYFPRLGNELHQHQKTGGGAFSLLAPHFDNDITWVDSSAWCNGMNQSDVWNIQLFGTAAPPNVRVGRQRAHAM